MTATLTDFLLARLSEDEAEARASIGRSPGAHWTDRGDPLHVLATLGALRRIVGSIIDGCGHSMVINGQVSFPRGWCDQCNGTLRALARIYSEHEDSREAWAL